MTISGRCYRRVFARCSETIHIHGEQPFVRLSTWRVVGHRLVHR